MDKNTIRKIKKSLQRHILSTRKKIFKKINRQKDLLGPEHFITQGKKFAILPTRYTNYLTTINNKIKSKIKYFLLIKIKKIINQKL